MASLQDIFDKNHSLCVTGYYKRDFNKFSMDFHKHDYIEIMLILSGSCTVYIKNKNNMRTRYLLKKNDFIVLDADIYHSLHVSGNQKASIANIEFSIEMKKPHDIIDYQSFKYIFPSFIKKILKNEFVVGKDVANVKESMVAVQLHCETYGKSTNKYNKNNFDIVPRTKLDMLIVDFFSALEECLTKTDYTNAYIDQLLKYIEDNYKDDISMDTAAEFLGIGNSYIIQLFAAHTETTFHRYLCDCRIRKAAELCKRRSNLTDIAFEVGFNNRQSFFNAFKRIKNISPYEYKKLLLQEKERNKQERDSNYQHKYDSSLTERL